jgi:hypothetical protein
MCPGSRLRKSDGTIADRVECSSTLQPDDELADERGPIH